MFRTSKVNFLRITSMLNSSILEIGDTKKLYSRSNILAIQEEGGTENDEDYSFENYPLFNLTLPVFSSKPIVKKQTINHDHSINVDAIDITGVSAASTTQLGSVGSIDAECRIKHIRILLDEQTNETNI
ncbi:hypothetical protein Pryu01_01709 [Paraliobacillus ryukyuensis]|uniref:Spore germination protein PE n=1 Tax=Paraliobacillus ryukyuensis TaxID=200904 RepID=A0A366E814_9BACI|nr:spore germination protein GerPE [Paraliobacillus ryukyuensis]RBO98225.1 spore germination protein PE [Paraliobacillus ryukyuensis]